MSTQDNHYDSAKRGLYSPHGNVVWGSDNVSNIQYPRVKIVWGADGTVNDASASAPLPVGNTNVEYAQSGSIGSGKGVLVMTNVGGSATFAQGDAAGGLMVSGTIAHDAADGSNSNPVKVGARASTALSGLTLVADADRTHLYAGIDGVLIVRPHCNLEDIVSGNATNTDAASTECIAAQASGIRTCLMSVTLANSSATNITVDIKDGTTVKWTFPVPASGGVTHTFPIPLRGTAATAWNFDGSAAATTLTCSMIGFKSKV